MAGDGIIFHDLDIHASTYADGNGNDGFAIREGGTYDFRDATITGFESRTLEGDGALEQTVALDG